ncbi:MAG: MerR family DNA-binding transcriptional regulator [Candidatus Omnitrophica bacterium]|nr:MerR family DNA-binding transcriptional regulator [Candidatus Omnitrophota bacterium]
MAKKRFALKDYWTIKQAADFLGVTTVTLRTWDKLGKLRAYRHPANRYRLYKRSELVAFLKRVKKRRQPS